MKISKTEYLPINKNFKGSFLAYPYKWKPKNADSYTNKSRSMLNLLEIDSSITTTIFLEFDSLGQLKFTYSDSIGTVTKLFNGRFSSKGFYEFFLRKDIVNIPPLIPIIFSRRDVDRLRIGLLTNNDLIIDNKIIRDGNILIFGGGGSDRTGYYFKRLN